MMPDPIAEKYQDKSPFPGKKQRMRKFIEMPDSETFLHHPVAGGFPNLHRVRDVNGLSQLEKGEFLARVNRRRFNIDLVFPKLNSKDRHFFDLTLSLVLQTADSRLFLREYGLPLLKSQDTIKLVSIESLLTVGFRTFVTDEMRRVTYEYLKIPEACPPEWWKTRISTWLNETERQVKTDWLKLVEVKAVSYDSPTGDRQLDIEMHEQHQTLDRKDRDRQIAAELEEKRSEVAREKSLSEIELSGELSEIEGQHRVDLIKTEQIISTLKKENEQLELTKKRAELEVGIANIRRDDERLRQAERNKEQIYGKQINYQNAQEEVAQSFGIMKSAYAQGIADGKQLSEYVADISPETLILIGGTDKVAYLKAIARDKANASPDAVSLKKLDLKSRDIGTRRVKSLRIGSSLEFELTSRRSGHVTVLNIGTSGAVCLLAPNGIVKSEEARLRADDPIGFPGAPLLPGLPLYENGPPGWEEMIVIVSRKPLFDYTDLAGADDEVPEVKLGGERVGQLVEQLSELPRDDWVAGVLGFVVEE